MTFVTAYRRDEGSRYSSTSWLVMPEPDTVNITVADVFNSGKKVNWIRRYDATVTLILYPLQHTSPWWCSTVLFGPLPNETDLRTENKHLSLCLCKILLNQSSYDYKYILKYVHIKTKNNLNENKPHKAILLLIEISLTGLVQKGSRGAFGGSPQVKLSPVTHDLKLLHHNMNNLRYWLPTEQARGRTNQVWSFFSWEAFQSAANQDSRPLQPTEPPASRRCMRNRLGVGPYWINAG